MPRLALAVFGLVVPAIAGAANAQPAGQRPAESPDVTVQGPERMVCRAQPRTATRMRTGRVCRTVQQWEEAPAGRSQDEVLAEAADTLDMFGEKVSTNCTGGMGRGHETPLGPR